MHFVYQGFTQAGNCRSYRFRGVEEHHPESDFAIAIDLVLLASKHISVQDGPMFCLQLLKNASTSGPAGLARLHNYLVAVDDFAPLLAERERREVEKAHRKPARRVVRKPAPSSNLRTSLEPHFSGPSRGRS